MIYLVAAAGALWLMSTGTSLGHLLGWPFDRKQVRPPADASFDELKAHRLQMRYLIFPGAGAIVASFFTGVCSSVFATAASSGRLFTEGEASLFILCMVGAVGALIFGFAPLMKRQHEASLLTDPHVMLAAARSIARGRAGVTRLRDVTARLDKWERTAAASAYGAFRYTEAPRLTSTLETAAGDNGARLPLRSRIRLSWVALRTFPLVEGFHLAGLVCGPLVLAALWLAERETLGAENVGATGWAVMIGALVVSMVIIALSALARSDLAIRRYRIDRAAAQRARMAIRAAERVGRMRDAERRRVDRAIELLLTPPSRRISRWFGVNGRC